MISQSVSISAAELNSASNTMKSVNASPPVDPGYPTGPFVILEAPFSQSVSFQKISAGAGGPGGPARLTETKDSSGKIVSTLTIDPVGTNMQSLVEYYWPREIDIINSTAADLEYRFIGSPEEEKEFILNPSKFEGVFFPNNSVLNNTLLPSSYRILFKKVSGTATSALRVDLLNYKKSAN